MAEEKKTMQNAFQEKNNFGARETKFSQAHEKSPMVGKNAPATTVTLIKHFV